jgi:hypothetical protein
MPKMFFHQTVDQIPKECMGFVIRFWPDVEFAIQLLIVSAKSSANVTKPAVMVL